MQSKLRTDKTIIKLKDVLNVKCRLAFKNSEKNWKIQKKSKLNSEKIWKIQKKIVK